MKTKSIISLIAASALTFAWILPARAQDAAAAAPTQCKDGTTSTATGRGACSGHGGVQKAASSSSASSASAPAATPPPASAPASGSAQKSSSPTSSTTTKDTTTKDTAAATTSAGTTKSAGPAPAGATAQCKDGTWSKSKTHSGTCSHHGGVDHWLN